MCAQAAFRRTFLVTVLFGLIQIANHCDAQSSCNDCQGRCNYCVDGQCTPRRHTFGHYETNWRRWPVPPPSIPVTESASDVGIGEQEFDLPAAAIDLPAAEDEGDLDPELPHRRDRAGSLPAVETPPGDPFQDEDVEGVPSAAPLPADGSTSRNIPRSFPISQSRFVTLPQPMGGNPLRSIQRPQSTQRVGYEQPIRQAPVAKPPRYANPLR